ncbi:tetratricopeptide repeat protein [Calycomorphotria hydatis]|uniref:Tetratricopeptide repeat protein n=1 Tax=Calycomorphotria hydatis TaxID=2528027 RepID=A0A517TEH0_9PLAN|nr:hypothetical protein [Calycomorphotria hydatis]QDT66755.1 Tetratricopeptide repeat protein [Calycomorphotria hydatis]
MAGLNKTFMVAVLGICCSMFAADMAQAGGFNFSVGGGGGRGGVRLGGNPNSVRNKWWSKSFSNGGNHHNNHFNAGGNNGYKFNASNGLTIGIGKHNGNTKLSIGIDGGHHNNHHLNNHNYGCSSKGYGFNYNYGGQSKYVNPYCSGHGIDAQPISAPQAGFGTHGDLFASAQEAFRRNDFVSAERLILEAAQQMPNNANVHHLRSLVYFATGDFRQSAAAAHTAMTASAGWDWATIQAMYGDPALYTNHLRRLEEAVKATGNDPALEFLLGYHYMTLGHKPAAARHLQLAYSLEPRDELAKQMLQLAGGAPAPIAQPQPQPQTQPQFQQTTQINTVQPQPQPQQQVQQPAPQQTAQPSGPVAQPRQPVATPSQNNNDWGLGTASTTQPTTPALPAHVGTFKSSPANNLEVTLNLNADNSFTWTVNKNGEVKSFSGNYTFGNGQLNLTRSDANSLTGAVKMTGNGFNFRRSGAGSNDPGLTFTKA